MAVEATMRQGRVVRSATAIGPTYVLGDESDQRDALDVDNSDPTQVVFSIAPWASGKILRVLDARDPADARRLQTMQQLEATATSQARRIARRLHITSLVVVGAAADYTLKRVVVLYNEPSPSTSLDELKKELAAQLGCFVWMSVAPVNYDPNRKDLDAASYALGELRRHRPKHNHDENGDLARAAVEALKDVVNTAMPSESMANEVAITCACDAAPDIGLDILNATACAVHPKALLCVALSDSTKKARAEGRSALSLRGTLRSLEAVLDRVGPDRIAAPRVVAFAEAQLRRVFTAGLKDFIVALQDAERKRYMSKLSASNVAQTLLTASATTPNNSKEVVLFDGRSKGDSALVASQTDSLQHLLEGSVPLVRRKYCSSLAIAKERDGSRAPDFDLESATEAVEEDHETKRKLMRLADLALFMVVLHPQTSHADFLRLERVYHEQYGCAVHPQAVVMDAAKRLLEEKGDTATTAAAVLKDVHQRISRRQLPLTEEVLRCVQLCLRVTQGGDTATIAADVRSIMLMHQAESDGDALFGGEPLTPWDVDSLAAPVPHQPVATSPLGQGTSSRTQLQARLANIESPQQRKKQDATAANAWARRSPSASRIGNTPVSMKSLSSEEAFLKLLRENHSAATGNH